MRRSHARAAFTLVEVIVALAIMAVIATLAWSTVLASMQARDFLEEQDAVDRSARVAIAQITRELELAFLTANTGAVNAYKTVFVGKDSGDLDQLWFATTAHRRTVRDSRACDQAEVTLWTEEDPHSEGGLLVLLHRETDFVDEEPDKGGAIQPLASAVKRFDLRYLDPTTNEWRAEWDTASVDTSGRLPRAVQIVLTIVGPDPTDDDRTLEHPYLTTVLIERAPRLKQDFFSDGGGK